MAKLKDSEITAQDLTEFVSKESDFAFEMRVLAVLRSAGLSCVHSGTYRDPVTAKIRQFDIRAYKSCGESTLSLAVECKNLRSHNPLLISAVPRTPAEAFHDLLVYSPAGTRPIFAVEPRTGNSSIYREGEMVGKQTDQVGRDLSGKLIGNDETTFEKCNQAVNSCQALVSQLLPRRPGAQRAVVPVLVIPTGVLWQVDYREDGVIVVPPRVVLKATIFLDTPWEAQEHLGIKLQFRLSHIDVVTLGALESFVDSWLNGGAFLPKEEMG